MPPRYKTSSPVSDANSPPSKTGDTTIITLRGKVTEGGIDEAIARAGIAPLGPGDRFTIRIERRPSHTGTPVAPPQRQRAQGQSSTSVAKNKVPDRLRQDPTALSKIVTAAQSTPTSALQAYQSGAGPLVRHAKPGIATRSTRALEVVAANALGFSPAQKSGSPGAASDPKPGRITNRTTNIGGVTKYSRNRPRSSTRGAGRVLAIEDRLQEMPVEVNSDDDDPLLYNSARNYEERAKKVGKETK